MKKLLVLALICAATVSVPFTKAAPLTDEQKAVRKEMLEKYDANKDGKLDKEERAKMTKEDKDKWNKAFPRKKKTTDSDSSTSSTTTNTPPASK